MVALPHQTTALSHETYSGDIMDLASQTQRNLTKRRFASSVNGSQRPYHPSLGHAFSSTANRFPSFGMVVSGDAERVSAETGTKEQVVDTGLNYEYLSGPSQHVLRQYHVADLSSTGYNLAFIAGVGLIFAGLQFPFFDAVTDKIKEVIRRPRPVAEGVALVAGTFLVGTSLGS